MSELGRSFPHVRERWRDKRCLGSVDKPLGQSLRRRHASRSALDDRDRLPADIFDAQVVCLPGPGTETPVQSNLAAHLPMSASALDAELLASLSSGPRWEAPSDRWLAMNTNIDVYGLPEMADPEVLKEKTPWL